MKKSIINKLEECLENIESLDYEQTNKILSKRNVVNSLNKEFGNIKKISYEDFELISSNHAVKQIIFKYFNFRNIFIDRYEMISLSDLNDFLVSYNHTICNYISLSDDEIEDCLDRRGDNFAFNSVVNSYLKFIFNECLKYSSDEVMFDDLLTEGNNCLINCVLKYDKKKHASFDNYFKYNLYDVLSLKSDVNKNSNIISLENTDICYSDFQDNLVNILSIKDYINDILQTSRLTAKEKLVLCYRFGLVDSNCYSPIDVASVLGIPRNEELVIETNAIKKIKSLHKKPVEILE